MVTLLDRKGQAPRERAEETPAAYMISLGALCLQETKGLYNKGCEVLSLGRSGSRWLGAASICVNRCST